MRLRRPTAALALAAALACGGLVPASAADTSSTVCTFDDQRFDEISGMTYSQLHDDVIYLHNDSSGGPRIYAVNATTCRTIATLTIAGIEARDLEAIGSGRDRRGRPVLWVADIGDNLDSWSEVRLHRVREPKVLRDRTLTPRTYQFTYRDRPHNAEALLADPQSTQVWIVTKQAARGRLYALPRRLSATHLNIATPVRTEGGLVTDGSVSPDGTRYVLRDYVDARLFTGLPPGADPRTVYLPLQLQGEAVTWTRDGSALLVAGERDNRLLRVEVPPAVTPTTRATSTPPSVSLTGEILSSQREVSSAQPAGQQGGSGAAVAATVTVGLVGLAVLLLATAEWRRRRAPGAPRG